MTDQEDEQILQGVSAKISIEAFAIAKELQKQHGLPTIGSLFGFVIEKMVEAGYIPDLDRVEGRIESLWRKHHGYTKLDNPDEIEKGLSSYLAQSELFAAAKAQKKRAPSVEDTYFAGPRDLDGSADEYKIPNNIQLPALSLTRRHREPVGDSFFGLTVLYLMYREKAASGHILSGADAADILLQNFAWSDPEFDEEAFYASVSATFYSRVVPLMKEALAADEYRPVVQRSRDSGVATEGMRPLAVTIMTYYATQTGTRGGDILDRIAFTFMRHHPGFTVNVLRSIKRAIKRSESWNRVRNYSYIVDYLDALIGMKGA